MDNRTIEEIRENETKIINEIKQLEKENQELKNLNRIYEEIISDDKENYKLLSSEIKKLENQQKEFIEYLENEKDRLARETSHIYEDEIGKVRLVNEDVFNEIIQNLKANKTDGYTNFCEISEEMLNAIKELSRREHEENKKYKEIIGGKE